MDMFWKKVLCLGLVMFVLACLMVVPVQAEYAPFILRTSDAVGAGDVFNVYGEGLNGDVKLFYAPMGDGATVQLNLAHQDPEGQFLTACSPLDMEPGQFLVWAEVNGVKSNTWVGNQPRPQWLEETKALQGGKIRVFGRNMTLPDVTTQIRLVNADTAIYPTIITANPYAIEVLIPDNTPIGTYAVETSLGHDLWFALEEKTTLEICATEVRQMMFTAETPILPPADVIFWESCVYENHVYALADGAYRGLRVYENGDEPRDITPDNPDLQFTPGMAAVGTLLIDGNSLYVLDWESPSHLRRYSLENPANPVLVSKHELQVVSTPRDMVLYDGVMYIAACGGIVTVQIDQLNSASSWRTGYDANMLSCALDDGKLYCTAFCESDQKSYVYIHQVQSDGTVTNIAKRGFAGFERISDIEIMNGYAYLGMRNENVDPWRSELGVLYVDGIETQEELDAAAFSVCGDVTKRISQFAKIQDYLYVATLDGEIYCLQADTPATPVVEATVMHNKVNWSMHGQNGKLYLGNADGGINIYTPQKSNRFAQDPLGLGVWWATEFAWDNQITPDIQDAAQATGAIQAAVNHAHATGGGVVNIPAGTFTVGCIIMKNGVVIRGAGQDQTIIESNASDWAVFRSEWNDSGNKGLQGVCDLTITLKDMENAPYYPDYAIYFIGGDEFEKVFVKNCKTVFPMDMRWNGEYGESSTNMERPKLSDDGRSIPVYSGKVKHILIDQCNFEGYMGAPYFLGDNRYIRMSHCNMHMNTGNAHLVGVYVVAENNTIQLEKERENPFDWNSEGIITRGPSYVAKNRIDGAGQEGHNDGEAILVESAGSYTKMLGNVTAAGNNFIRVDGARYIRNWNLDDNAWGNWHAVIIDGRGLGQYRKIQRLDEQNATIYVDDPWDIVPDNTSKYAVVLPILSVTAYQNTITNCSKGIWFYNNTIDGIIDGNNMENTSGCYSNALDLGGTGEMMVSYYNRMVNNIVRGVSEKNHVAGIGETAILWVDTDAYAYQIYGSELRDNVVDGDGKQAQVVSQILESPDINGIYMGHAVRIDALERPVVKGGVITGNIVKNSDRGITVGGGLYPETWFHRDSFNVRGTTGIVLADNHFDNTQLPYHYDLASKNLPLSDVILASNTIGVSPDVEIYANGVRLQQLEKGKLSLQTSIRNIGQKDIDLKIFAAVFAQNQMQDIQSTDMLELVAEQEKTVSVNIDLTGYETLTDKTVKFFIWSNEGLVPLLNTEYQKEG